MKTKKVRYEYRTLNDYPNHGVSFDLDDINKLGSEGFRVVGWVCNDGGYEGMIFERRIEE
jgi:hypothetical protein